MKRCLNAIIGQQRQPFEIIVVLRSDDTESLQLLSNFPVENLRPVFVRVPGVIAAMNAGLAAAQGDIVAFTDDDAAPWPDWLGCIEQLFQDNPQVACVGGRDWQYKGSPLALDDGIETRAGMMQWWGRVIGQHHWAAAGPAREVDVIKGVNCAFRADALRAVGGFDTRLAGTGAQVHWEMAVCLALKRAGWKVLFDPSLGVDHFPAARFDEDQRGLYNSLAQRNMVYNETLVLVEHLRGIRRVAFVVWAFLIGTRGAPGLVQVPRLMLLLRQRHAGRRWIATVAARSAGLIAGLRASGSNDRGRKRLNAGIRPDEGDEIPLVGGVDGSR